MTATSSSARKRRHASGSSSTGASHQQQSTTAGGAAGSSGGGMRTASAPGRSSAIGGSRWAQIDDSGADSPGGALEVPSPPRRGLCSRLTSWQCAAVSAFIMAAVSVGLLSSFGRSVAELTVRAAAAAGAGRLAATPSPSALAKAGGQGVAEPSFSATRAPLAPSVTGTPAAPSGSASVSVSGTVAPTPSSSAPAAAASGAVGSVYDRVDSLPTSWTLLNTYPHDTGAFTQGFQWHGGELLEGTGMNGESVLRRVSLTDDAYAVLGQVSLAANYFGEGICVWTDARGTYGVPGRDVVFQITWQDRTGFVYDAATLSKLREFSFSTTVNQGWGITHDGTHLIVSDGSAYLHFWDPDTLQEVRRVRVTDPAAGGAPQTYLNELEFVHGWVWANVWQTDMIVVIDPTTGAIARRWNMRELSVRVTNAGRDVLNGIAYTLRRGLPSSSSDGGAGGGSGDAAPWGGSLWVTGKRWDKIFELALTDPQPVARGGTRALGDGGKRKKGKKGGKAGGGAAGAG